MSGERRLVEGGHGGRSRRRFGGWPGLEAEAANLPIAGGGCRQERVAVGSWRGREGMVGGAGAGRMLGMLGGRGSKRHGQVEAEERAERGGHGRGGHGGGPETGAGWWLVVGRCGRL